jgi:NADP-dependent 3-hydroxy acid dehydrogenase YdfG
MKKFKGKTAVITGAASGIGLGLTERCAAEGMNIVMADIDEEELKKSEKNIRDMGAKVLAVKIDVSDSDQMKELAEKTVNTFGEVNLLFNNAGVSAGKNVWESTLSDWQWVLGVNLWGLINGIHYFMPIFIKQDNECHIVNTSSIAGLVTSMYNSPYVVSKMGIVALSEQLYRELVEGGYKIGVSVICPGFVDTNFMECEKHRPVSLRNQSDGIRFDFSDPTIAESLRQFRQMYESGLSRSELADIVFKSIEHNKFYILANGETSKPSIQARIDDIIHDRNPSDVFPEIKPR